MIIQDVTRNDNQNNRVAGMFGDGIFTRYIEIVKEWINGEAVDVIYVCDAEFDGENKPIVRHKNYDLKGRNFAPRSITTRRSGFDGKLIVTIGGFTPDSNNSRRITIKTDLQIDPAV